MSAEPEADLTFSVAFDVEPTVQLEKLGSFVIERPKPSIEDQHVDDVLQRIREHDLPVEAFQWYLDLRRYGSCPHSGFGMGLECFVAWVCGLKHLRETIPYPRMLNKIYP